MKSILEEAAEITSQARQYDYGDASANHGCAAELKAAYRKRRAQITEEFDAVDHCIEMILVKVARLAHRRKRDSVVDVVGYCVNIEEMMREEWERDRLTDIHRRWHQGLGSVFDDSGLGFYEPEERSMDEQCRVNDNESFSAVLPKPSVLPSPNNSMRKRGVTFESLSDSPQPTEGEAE